MESVLGILQNNHKKNCEQVTIKKWGNSQGIRIPKNLLAQANLHEDDQIELTVEDDKIVMEKVQETKYLSLKERLENYYGRPLNEIQIESSDEIDTGAPVGQEIW